MYRQKMVPDVSNNLWKVWKSEFWWSDSGDLLLLLEMRPERNALDLLVESEPALGVVEQRLGQALKKACESSISTSICSRIHGKRSKTERT
jgi:hypothetical protein